MNKRFAAMALSAAALGGTLTACGDDLKDQVVDNALEDTGVELEGLGGEIPASFPSEVPLPTEGVTLESAVGAGGTYTMRYAVTDARAAVTAYKAQLEAAGFTITGDVDTLDEGGNAAVVAEGKGFSVNIGAFGPPTDTNPDGNYMGVAVVPL